MLKYGKMGHEDKREELLVDFKNSGQIRPRWPSSKLGKFRILSTNVLTCMP
jgi:hypothetical protein